MFKIKHQKIDESRDVEECNPMCLYTFCKTQRSYVHDRDLLKANF